MAGNSNSKLKLLRIVDILTEESDENHPMSAADITAALSEYGITAERKSIYSDLKVLEEYGVDIVSTSLPKKGVYIGERDFQIAEVRLLIDAIQSAKFITEKKTDELVRKIEKSLSRSQRRDLSGQVYVDNRNKTENEMLYYNIDKLNVAIAERKMVSITYHKRRTEVCGDNKFEDRMWTVSPYALLWSEDYYYLICNNKKYDNFMHLRIDKMTKINVTGTPARPFSEISEYTNHFDIADYAAKHFNMFSGKMDRVHIRCSEKLLDVVTDKFGSNVMITDKDMENDTFDISVNVAVSDGFISWILQYGKDMVVLEPDELRSRILEKAKETVLAYEI